MLAALTILGTVIIAPAWGARDLSYYTRENCAALGKSPKWAEASYVPGTHFERHFKSPLAIDLLAAAHSSNETGFEQVTADWGCDYKQCYGECLNEIGFYGPGAKDPAGGGCPHGPVRVYEDLACAIQLGLDNNPDAFKDFCAGESEGLFECLAFFANVITETGAFAEMEERDPRPYCWNRSDGNSDCCPAVDHKPCLPDSSAELSPNDYPTPNDRWLTDKSVENKCCSYHGRGPLQVSYEPNYRALSSAMVGDEKVLWHHPYKLDADGVAGWTAALWFWFNKHPAQIMPVNPEEIGGLPQEELQKLNTSPRERLLAWKQGGGLPGVINIINGGECSGTMSAQKVYSRVSYFFAAAHRMNATEPGSQARYALPGTAQCSQSEFCKAQFGNPNSDCAVLRSGVSCLSPQIPYVANISTPIGFNRATLKMVANDGQTPLCTRFVSEGAVPEVWDTPQRDLIPIPTWETMLDVTVDNVCDYMQMSFGEQSAETLGNSEMCRQFCWCDHTVWGNGCTCSESELSRPCKAMSEWLSRPTPFKSFEQGLADYKGGVIHGRVGPGLVMAFNGNYGLMDLKDKLCYWYGNTPCSWNIALKPPKKPDADIHNCKVRLPQMHPEAVAWTDVSEGAGPQIDEEDKHLQPGHYPARMLRTLQYFDRSKCPEMKGETILEKLFPDGELAMDLIFSSVYSGSDGFDNAYFEKEYNYNVNYNKLGLGKWGPRIVWRDLVCAFQLGIPSDPTIFQRKFGLKADLPEGGALPSYLDDEARRFALFETISFFANVIKETGALGQAEEQDPRQYCNNQGGALNKCCPNEWGNNAACYTTTTPGNDKIPPEELIRALGTNATCCSYHGRGFLQVSYEKNYGDIGAQLLRNKDLDVDEALGRRFGVNFPQFIDAFGVTGWASSLLYWLGERPCQFCGGRNSSSADWNAGYASPHKAIQRYNEPGQGLGLTFTIINGQECEAAFTAEQAEAPLGSHARLSLFYNLAYKLNAKPPGETSDFYPLPGTVECDRSPWCRGTFYESEANKGTYREHSGGCWALTPQPSPTEPNKEFTPVCVPSRVQGSTRYGSRLDTISFSMKKESGCTSRQFLSCGVQLIDTTNRPSMRNEPFEPFTKNVYPAVDHRDERFNKFVGKSLKDICKFVKDKDPSNNLPPGGRSCFDWCVDPSGAASCKALDQGTCYYQGSGIPFIDCANRFFQSMAGFTTDCYIDINDIAGEHNTVQVVEGGPWVNRGTELGEGSGPGIGTNQNSPCKNCATCVSVEGKSWTDEHCAKCSNGSASNEWPCQTANYCKCSDSMGPGSGAGNGSGTENGSSGSGAGNGSGGSGAGNGSGGSGAGNPIDPSHPCKSCSACVSVEGNSWSDEHCLKCSNGNALNDWPCQTAGYCKCA